MAKKRIELEEDRYDPVAFDVEQTTIEALRGGVATRADLMEVKSDLEKQITRLDGKFTLLSWMVGVVIALSLAIVGKLLIVHS